MLRPAWAKVDEVLDDITPLTFKLAAMYLSFNGYWTWKSQPPLMRPQWSQPGLGNLSYYYEVTVKRNE